MFFTPEAHLQSSEFDGIFSKIGNAFMTIGKVAAPMAANMFLPGSGAIVSGVIGAAGGKAARGLEEITAFGNQVMSAFDQLIANAQNGQPRAEVEAMARQLKAVLYDPAKTYQPKKGDDLDALNNFKSQADEKTAQAIQIATAIEAQKLAAQTGTAANGANSPQLIAGVDNSVLYLGGGLMALLLLK